MKKSTIFLFLLAVAISSNAQFNVTTIIDEDFESTSAATSPYSHGFPGNFNCKKQTTWTTLNANNNPNPYTGLLWKDAYGSTSTAANKTYSVEIAAEEGANKAGASQCLKVNLTDLAYSVADNGGKPATVRIRSVDNVVSFTGAETTAKYGVQLWAKTADGTTRKVFLNGTDTIAVTGTWTKYSLKRYVTGISATALALDFARQADHTDYSVLIDGFTLVQLPILTANDASQITSEGFTANWTAINGATSYSLSLQTTADGGTTWTSVTGYPATILGGSTESLAITGLASNTQYRYRLTATDGTYTTEFTSWIPVTTTTSTGIENVAIKKIVVAAGKIIVTTDAGQLLEVYNAAGQKTLSTTTYEGENIISLNQRGLYILKVGNESKKIIL